MRIKCPECEASLNLKAPKPGSYKPKCNKCGKPFRLKVTDDDPPKFGVGKLKPTSKKKTASNPQAQANDSAAAKKSSAAAKQAVHAGPANSGPAKSISGTVDATMDSVAPGNVGQAAKSSVSDSADEMDATMDGTIAENLSSETAAGNAMEATMDGSADGRTVGGAMHTDAGVDATMDGGSQDPSSQDPTSQDPSSQTMASDSVVQSSGANSSAGSSVSRGGSQSMVRPGNSAAKSQTSVSRGGSAAKSSSGSVAGSKPASSGDLPERLGGYRIMRLLGRGAMGAVYEAKQVSLDRFVALKTIRSRLASNPATLARFTREAYAAAQLTHHNVVQIYDFGEDSGKHFFSMEWVRGGPLDELVKEKGSLDPKLAAGYVLQAARGLSIAHRNGMVHRDIKPANLLLNDEGVVKVADLGLVKIPDLPDPESDVGASSADYAESGTQVTMQGTAVGTPAYMAPEQGVDAANVDHRADIYSLGCTLFYLLTGQPPFEGSVVSEVMQQHANQPLPEIRSINSRVPEQLERVIRRSMEKRPDDRYESLDVMCDDLESYLGVSDDGKFSPTSAQADELEGIASVYARATKAEGKKGLILTGTIALAIVMTLATFVLGWKWSLMGVTFFFTAVGLAIGLAGGQSQVNLHFRKWIGSLRWLDYVIAVVGVIAITVVALISGLFVGMIFGAILGVVAGLVYHVAVTQKSSKAGEVVADKARRFIRDLRISGADEQGIRSFVARYSGKNWQRMFEKLFGYDALRVQRAQLAGDASFDGDTSASSLRDRVCANLNRRIDANRQQSDHARLAELEQKSLQAEGLSSSEAKERAWQMASAVMDASQVSDGPVSDAKAAAQEKRDRMKAMLADARSGKYAKQRDKLAPVRWLLGGQTRLLVGCLLLAVFAIWGNSNGIFDSLKELDIQQIRSGDVDLSTVADAAKNVDTETAKAEMMGGNFNPWSIGVAGLLLVLSAFISGWRMTPFAIVASIAILFGPSLGIPGFGEAIHPWMVAALVGVVVYIPGIMFGEAKDH